MSEEKPPVNLLELWQQPNISPDYYEQKNIIRVTWITMCPYKTYMTTFKGVKPNSIQSVIARMLGTALHKEIEARMREQGFTVEKRGYKQLKGCLLSGKCDVNLGNSVLVDWKLTTYPPKEIKPMHKDQLIQYCNIFEVKHGWVCYLSTAFSPLWFHVQADPLRANIYLDPKAEWLANQFYNTKEPVPIPQWPKECNFCEVKDNCPRIKC